MDFAKRQLEKYGWSEGKGLGKDESGSQEALKPKPKHGTGGVGHSIADEFTNNWWQRIYDKAAENIQVKTEKNGQTRKLSSKSSDTFNIDTRKFVKAKKSSTNKSYLQSFVKRATLKGNEIEEVNKKDESSDSEEEKLQTAPNMLTDEELFAACGGRTAHKGARHGLKSNGKLARIMEQEKDLYNNLKRKKDKIMETVQQTHKHGKVGSYDHTGKKIGDTEILEIKQSAVDGLNIEELETTTEIDRKVKNKKKKRKCD